MIRCCGLVWHPLAIGPGEYHVKIHEPHVVALGEAGPNTRQFVNGREVYTLGEAGASPAPDAREYPGDVELVALGAGQCLFARSNGSFRAEVIQC